jgi:hypothetical protein
MLLACNDRAFLVCYRSHRYLWGGGGTGQQDVSLLSYVAVGLEVVDGVGAGMLYLPLSGDVNLLQLLSEVAENSKPIGILLF